MNIERRITFEHRIREVTERLYSKRIEISLARGDDKRFKKIERGVAALEAATDRICEALVRVHKQVVLSTPKRHSTLRDALVTIARQKGSALLPRDLLKSLVVANVSGDAQIYWEAESDGQPIGHIRSSESFRNGLKALGVLVWIRDLDMLTRLIDVNWLHSHQDIFEFVNSEAGSGKRCRFCRIVEPRMSIELQRIRPETTDGIVTHGPCAEHWLRLEKIAAQYTSIDKAIAADKAAGREVSEKPATESRTEQVA